MSTAKDIKIGLLKQIFPPSVRPDVKKTLAEGFARAGFNERIRPGQRVLITSGSRGIESMLEVVAAVVELVRAAGGRPLILPAMGSHGGGTPAGQIEVLAHLGQTEETLGAPIYDQYDSTVIGQVLDGVPVPVDRAALPENTDHIILVGRIKEHSEFSGPIQSGLIKMGVVGLGRRDGATVMHRAAVKYTYVETIKAMGEVIFEKCPILGGVGLVDDYRNILHRLEVLTAAEIPVREPELLVLSQEVKPQLPYEKLDLLLVDEMGKDISGSCLDTKVIGRIMNIYEKELTSPAITRIVTRKMSEKGGGNALGLGLSDFITRKLYDQVDWEMTNLNTVIAISPEKGRCPIVAPTDLEALRLALETVGPWRPETLSLAWIVSTKELEYLAVSPTLYEAAAGRPDLVQISPPEPLPFDDQGELPDLADYFTRRIGSGQ